MRRGRCGLIVGKSREGRITRFREVNLQIRAERSNLVLFNAKVSRRRVSNRMAEWENPARPASVRLCEFVPVLRLLGGSVAWPAWSLGWLLRGSFQLSSKLPINSEEEFIRFPMHLFPVLFSPSFPEWPIRKRRSDSREEVSRSFSRTVQLSSLARIHRKSFP